MYSLLLPSRSIKRKLALPLLNMLELFTCTLMLPATFTMIFYISYGTFNALIFPCCRQLLSSCFKESSKFWRQFQAAKFCKFQYASVLILNAAEPSTILPPFQCNLTLFTM